MIVCPGCNKIISQSGETVQFQFCEICHSGPYCFGCDAQYERFKALCRGEDTELVKCYKEREITMTECKRPH